MGTDIHGVVEQQLPSGEWVSIGRFGTRNYWMFARMAGVRNRSYFTAKRAIELVKEDLHATPSQKQNALKELRQLTRKYGPAFEPRGLPANASSLIQHMSDRMASDGHSHSWLTAEEMRSLVKKGIKAQYKELMESSIGYRRFAREQVKRIKAIAKDSRTDGDKKVLKHYRKSQAYRDRWENPREHREMFLDDWFGLGEYDIMYHNPKYDSPVRVTFFFDN